MNHSHLLMHLRMVTQEWSKQMANMNGGGKKSASEVSIADPQIILSPGNPQREKTAKSGQGTKKKS